VSSTFEGNSSVRLRCYLLYYRGMRAFRWALIVLSSLSLAGSRTLAYDLNFQRIPLLDVAILLLLAGFVLVSHRQIVWRARAIFLVVVLGAVSIIALVDSAGTPNEQSLRLLMPFGLFALALTPVHVGWRRSDLRWLLALPVTLHFTLNVMYLAVGAPESGSTQVDQLRDLLFPSLARSDALGLIYGFGVLALADRVAKRGRVGVAALAGVAYFAIAGQIASESKGLLFGVAACALAVIGHGLKTRQARLRRFGAAAMSAVVVSFFLAPVLVSWQTPESTPTTTTPTTTTPTTTARPDAFERLAIQGSETSRLDTWGDILRATDGASRAIFGGDSSDTNLLLNACGFLKVDYDASPLSNKCAVDNGFANFPLQFAHNWLFTSYLYFGLIGVASLAILLVLSLRDSVVVFRSTPMAAAPAVFWLIGLTSVMLWSPFVLSHAAVVTLAINSLARQSSQGRADV